MHLKPIDEAVNTQSFQVGLGFPNLGKPGALGVLTFVVPIDIVKGRKYFVAGGGDGGTMLELETSYYYPLTDNLAIAPAFHVISNPNNFDRNPGIYVGNLRAQFNF
ncbi:carbohydrate porin [Trichocoleus sp. FACHB-262]|uniref:carbohydrate porin n=1 Tax=Trichocoleus sp. FACHB-262 TaxID=2692869 RepID=UPI0016897527|nr:carbohydrate porin [Trichocoleus sp. FACHB-262]MBD2121134.1 carbohydrate porin [Trichocoleus sp. FACHB-262]